MKRIVIEVNSREARVLMHYALALASRDINESVRPWEGLSRVLREASNIITFPVHDEDEARELKRHGVRVEKGQAYLDSRSAVRMIDMMAGSREMYKDVPTVTSLVRKIATKLGRQMPKIQPGGEASGRPGDVTAADQGATQHPGAAQARFAQAEPMQDLMSPEEHEALYGRVGYEPTAKQEPPAVIIPPYNPEDPGPVLTPVPGTQHVFKPRVRDVPQAPPGETIDPRQWSQELSDEDRAKVMAQDVSSMQQSRPQSQLSLPTGAAVQDPKKQERTAETEAGTEDLMSIFDDPDLKEMRRLLRTSPWSLMEESYV